MRESSPYKTIAVATTFSPRFKHVLAEAKRICDRFAAELHLIHVGKGDQETPRKFSDVLAELESCKRLYVIGIITAFDEARASIAGDANGKATHKPNHHDEDALEELVLSAGATEVPIETRFIRGATGLAASDFVRSVEADLLVVPLPKNRETVQQLPSNIAWVSDVIPCNLWVVR